MNWDGSDLPTDLRSLRRELDRLCKRRNQEALPLTELALCEALCSREGDLLRWAVSDELLRAS